MQAKVHTNSGFGFDRLKVALVAAGVLATTIAGTAAVQLSSDTANMSAARVSSAATAPHASWRFQEINALPAGVTRVDYTEMRFADMNQIPGAAAKATSYRDFRFQEINALPEAPVTAPATSNDDRFL